MNYRIVLKNTPELSKRYKCTHKGGFVENHPIGMSKNDMSNTLSEEQKQRLKAIPKSRCAKCDSPRSYINPMAKCFFCHRKHCFDHLTAGITTKDMKPNDEVRDCCDDCLKKNP